MALKAKIIGTGSYLPERVLSNRDLEKIVETSDEWIVTRTGMRERRIAHANEYSSSMGIEAARRAIANAKLSADDIDFIIVSTITPDYLIPSTACLIQQGLGAKNAAAVALQEACTGFLYALSMAKALAEVGMYRNILVVCVDKLSSVTNYKDRSTCVLFGDGSGACVVSSQGQGLELTSICLGADGGQADLLVIPAGGSRQPASLETVQQDLHFIKMSGNEVFKHAVRRMEAACKECLEKAELHESDISYLIPHQANLRIIDAIGKRFEHLPAERLYKTIHKYGNTSSSSIAIALDELLKEGKILAGERVLLTAFGSGLTWGAAILSAEPKI
jgi:3-oxoacyl-[acyl-carrier-protein] synthase III